MASPFSTKPTQKDLEARQAKLAGKMIILEPKKLAKFVQFMLQSKVKSDIGFTFHQQYHDFMVMNKDEAKGQMLLWKQMAKDGKIMLLEGNNREYDVEGKMIYSFVVQPTNQNHSPCICPLSLAMGTMVSGFTYAFTKKENRDSIYTYVKKYMSDQ